MNTDTNQFYIGAPQSSEHIPFSVGEEITVKGHIFEVVTIDIPKNPTQPHLLVLRPIRKKSAVASLVDSI